MDILQMIMSASGGGAVRQVADRLGLDESQANSAIASLLPALMGGIQNNISQQGGMESLLGALTRGHHSQYLDDPSSLGSEGALQDGNGILGHLLGSKDVSRQVASHAAAQTGIGADIMKQLLPLVATMAMGALAKGGTQQGFLGQSSAAPQANQGILGMLTPFLDSNGDGSIADDMIGMVGKLLRR